MIEVKKLSLFHDTSPNAAVAAPNRLTASYQALSSWPQPIHGRSIPTLISPF